MKAKVVRGVLSICLVMMALVTIVPVSYAEDYYDVTKRFNSRVQRPKNWSILDEAETCDVTSTYGNCIYMYKDPTKAQLVVAYKIPEGTECTLIARKNSMYFVITEYGHRGWVNANLLSYYYW